MSLEDEAHEARRQAEQRDSLNASIAKCRSTYRWSHLESSGKTLPYLEPKSSEWYDWVRKNKKHLPYLKQLPDFVVSEWFQISSHPDPRMQDLIRESLPLVKVWATGWEVPFPGASNTLLALTEYETYIQQRRGLASKRLERVTLQAPSQIRSTITATGQPVKWTALMRHTSDNSWRPWLHILSDGRVLGGGHLGNVQFSLSDDEIANYRRWIVAQFSAD